MLVMMNNKIELNCSTGLCQDNWLDILASDITLRTLHDMPGAKFNNHAGSMS